VVFTALGNGKQKRRFFYSIFCGSVALKSSGTFDFHVWARAICGCICSKNRNIFGIMVG
jgi:hypothetical protein